MSMLAAVDGTANYRPRALDQRLTSGHPHTRVDEAGVLVVHDVRWSRGRAMAHFVGSVAFGAVFAAVVFSKAPEAKRIVVLVAASLIIAFMGLVATLGLVHLRSASRGRALLRFDPSKGGVELRLRKDTVPIGSVRAVCIAEFTVARPYQIGVFATKHLVLRIEADPNAPAWIPVAGHPFFLVGAAKRIAAALRVPFEQLRLGEVPQSEYNSLHH